MKNGGAFISDPPCPQLECSLRGTRVGRWGERRHPVSWPELLNKPWQSIQQQMPPPACPDMLFPAHTWFHWLGRGKVFQGFSSVVYFGCCPEAPPNQSKETAVLHFTMDVPMLCKWKNAKKEYFILISSMAPTLTLIILSVVIIIITIFFCL